MEIVPDSGYGVVVLLNSGSGLMLDQTGIFYGVRDIVEGTNLTPPGPAGAKYNATTLDRVLGLLTLAVLLLGARGVLRARRWARRRKHQSWIFAGARTVPHLAVLAGVAAYPQLAERLVGGREVTWEAAAYGWPALTVLVWTVLLATFATLVSRAWQLARGGTSRPTPAATSSGSTSDLGASSVMPSHTTRALDDWRRGRERDTPPGPRRPRRSRSRSCHADRARHRRRRRHASQHSPAGT
jgi:hypothetical protein